MSMTLAAAIFLAATTARPAALSSDAPPPGPQAEAAILQIECETVTAHLTGDAEKLDPIWADEYGRFLPNGAVLAKPDYLPCDTPEEFCSIDEEIDCENVSRGPDTASSTRLRRR